MTSAWTLAVKAAGLPCLSLCVSLYLSLCQSLCLSLSGYLSILSLIRLRICVMLRLRLGGLQGAWLNIVGVCQMLQQ